MATHVKSSPSLHADKFRVAIAALIGLGLGAIAVAVAVIIAHDNTSSNPTAVAPTSTSQWSTWHPTDSGNLGAGEIADYIAPRYRLTGSQQLALITPISTTQLNVSTDTFTGSGLTVALTVQKATGPSIEPLEGETVAYDICGQGSASCALTGGSSAARTLLLRREALELALYTFEYLPKAQNVAVVLPPVKQLDGKASKTKPEAVLFLRSVITPSLLVEPINETLTAVPPAVTKLATWSKGQEAELVAALTTQNLFSERVENEQGVGALLVLGQLPEQ
jgi:hypothetical protein